MARSYFQLSSLILIFASMHACSYEVRHIQYSIAVRPTDKDDAALLRAAVKKFSNGEGFLIVNQAGNEKYLEENGRYLLSFAGADNSYVSISNIVDTNCYDVGVHSNANVDAAKAMGERLKLVLHAAISGEIEQSANCR